MSDEKREAPWIITTPDYNENRNKFTYEQLVPSAGQYVAWALDGTRILASGFTLVEAEAALVAAGGDQQQVIWSSLPTVEEWDWSFLGGGSLLFSTTQDSSGRYIFDDTAAP
jgi:hypothetical protein